MSSEGPIIRSLAGLGMTNQRNGRTSDPVLDAVGWMQFARLVGCRGGALLRSRQQQVALADVASKAGGALEFGTSFIPAA